MNSVNLVEIIRLSPSVLEKGLVWFEHNKHLIRRDAKKLSSFWQNNYFVIQPLELFPMSNLMRRLADWGYVKTQNVKSPGEFANRGGILDIFPLSEKHAFRIEYEGNMILHIMALENIAVKDENEKLKNLIPSQPQVYSKEFSRKDAETQKLLDNLVPGSYVVHIDHGIARFAGITQDNFKFKISNFKSMPPMASEKKNKVLFSQATQTSSEAPILNDQISKTEKTEYLELEYAQGDKLLVPVSIASQKVSPYIGFGEPHLIRLGGNLWEKTKRKVSEDIIKTARELARVYAKREITKREKYEFDPHIERELEKTFPYTETQDQLQALEQIKRDLAGTTPMDRIICGDVGFGKTEVALRAAMLAVSAGYQVGFVAPTTVLAHQHYKTFQNRLAQINYPINVEKLSRVESKKQQAETLKHLGNGKCDIVIGTHRILQKDARFKNLGLLIIDEEQRFGVKQKEFFKAQRAQLDILSLSATPIPRTLSFALSGLRDISVIATPPQGRLPIKTYVAKLDKNIIKEAAKRELKRGGQIYFLHNKISSLGKTIKELEALLPKADIDFMHAKLPEAEIIAKMEKFTEGKIDILVTTTIMENGLDLENANTLIVDNASLLGLAQAHQIRGRIGRGNKQAYAYFLYPSSKLPPKSKQRMAALKEAQYLGAGYQIALRDLEIRGAGSFLGRAQSGNIAKVGFNLYHQMLAEAIEEIRSTNTK